MRCRVFILAVVMLWMAAATTAAGGASSAVACGVQSYSYAGVQASQTAEGVAATLVATEAPSVSEGHVGGWVGVGGPGAGPDGQSEWLQAGYASFPGSSAMQMYYEVTLPGSQPRYVELSASVPISAAHRFAVLEMVKRPDWWRVWVDGEPVSPPIHLPGSDGAWYPQAIGENWNGGAGACNAYAYRFTDVNLAEGEGFHWKPMTIGYEFQDPGYSVEPVSSVPRTFVTTSLSFS